MKNYFRVFLLCFLAFFFTNAKAGLTDSLFSIKDADDRLNTVDYLFHRYDIKSPEALQFKNEVLEKGNDSEKLIIQWMWEDRLLASSNMDSSIAIFDRYLPKAKKTGNPNLLAILYSVKANALLFARRYSLAFENYLYAYDNLKKDPDQAYYGHAWLLYNIAMNFYLFKDYHKTIEISHEASVMPKPVNYSAGWFDCINYDLTAMAYLRIGKHDSAKYWLDKTYQAAVNTKDTAWIGIALGNMGLVNYEQGLFDKAIPDLEKGIAYCTATNIWDNVSPFSSSLAHIYISKKDFAKAGALLSEAKEATNKFYKLDNTLLYYNTASLYEKSTGNYSKAFELLDSARFYEKKSNSEFEISKRALAESRVAYEKQLMENKLLQQKASSEEWRFYWLAIIALLLSVTLILFIKRQRLRYSLQKEKLQNEKLKAENELSVALYEIKEFTHNITEKNRDIEKLLSKVQSLEDSNVPPSTEEETVQEPKSTPVMTEEDWADFDQMFEKAFPGLSAKMTKKLPEINEREIRYLKLVVLEISENETAGMLGTDIKQLPVIRQQLVDKLGLTDEEEIEILLESL